MTERRLLDGIKVLDLSRAIAGPYCTMLLGDLGADVIKVEPPEGDSTRRALLSQKGGQSTFFVSMNRNKKSIVIDLKSQQGLDVLARLVRESDVLVENFRVGVLARLGLSYDKLRELNSSLIICSISGYGQVSPYSDRKALDLIGQTMSGLAGLTGDPDGPPTPAGVPVADVVTALNATISVLAALLGRQLQPGEFPLTTTDVSLVGSTLAMLTVEATSYLNTGVVPQRHGGAWFQLFPYDVFPSKDGWVAIGSGADWDALCSVLALEDLRRDERFHQIEGRLAHRQQLKRRMSEATKKWGRDELVELLQSRDILSGPVYALDEVFADPALQAAEIELNLSHSVMGKTRTVASGTKYWMGEPGKTQWPSNTAPPPMLGEDTLSILAGLGYSDEEATLLCDIGAVSFLPAHAEA